MQNTKIPKPLKTKKDYDDYAKLAKWCNDNNYTIEETATHYICKKIQPHTATIQEQINEFENKITPRRQRNAILGIQEDIDFIKDIENKINVLRKQF